MNLRTMVICLIFNLLSSPLLVQATASSYCQIQGKIESIDRSKNRKSKILSLEFIPQKIIKDSSLKSCISAVGFKRKIKVFFKNQKQMTKVKKNTVVILLSKDLCDLEVYKQGYCSGESWSFIR